MGIRIDRIRAGITNSYLVRGDGAMLIDPGEPGKGPTVLRKLSAILDDPSEIGLILATHGHYDHVGAAPALCDATGAKLAMHTGDAGWARDGDFIPLQPTTTWGRIMFRLLQPVTRRLQRANPVDADVIFDDAGISLEEFGIPARVIPTPGHTPGSISVLLENGDAIVGDLVMSGPPLVLKPSLAVVAYDPAQMRESWLHLLELGAKTVYPAHGKPFPVEALRVLQKGIYTVIGSTVTLAP